MHRNIQLLIRVSVPNSSMVEFYFDYLDIPFDYIINVSSMKINSDYKTPTSELDTTSKC